MPSFFVSIGIQMRAFTDSQSAKHQLNLFSKGFSWENYGKKILSFGDREVFFFTTDNHINYTYSRSVYEDWSKSSISAQPS